MSDSAVSYWYSRWLFERSLALLYLVAFLCAVNQFVPLLGERGLLPFTRFVRYVPFRESPSLLYFFPTDRAAQIMAWLGVVLSCVALSGYPQAKSTIFAASIWIALWLLYLSFVNVGQTFYGFGWESLLLETGLFAVFAGSGLAPPNVLFVLMLRWILFRVMFGAGMIKWRGDSCWHDLTCLNYYFETQPIPNGLSWYFHWLPAAVHRGGVLFNHVVELIVPFGYFAPQPVARVAGVMTILFQLVLIVSGNLSWLNWLTLVLCIATIDDRWLSWLPVARPELQPEPLPHRAALYLLTGIVVIASIRPVRNLLSSRQLMNTSFNSVHFVNTYGAFGSITRERQEIVIEGTADAAAGSAAGWKEYEFKGKPGDVTRRPTQIAPYHLRIDWLMWFAAMSPTARDAWFSVLMARLLEGDPATIGLLRTNPFPERPPQAIRALLYRYRFTTPEEHRRTGAWWVRELIGTYYPVSALRTPASKTK
jgi:lipase maturation factor